MALIGITCNNNDSVDSGTGEVTYSKIGRTPPFIDAIVKAFSFVEDTGIFDYADDCSITIPIDYVSAVGYGRVTFNEGFGFIKGRAFYIEPNTTFDVPLTATTGGSIGIKVDLTKSAGLEFAFYSKTTQTLMQDDLIENRATGVYEFEIYKYTCADNVITLGTQATLRTIKLKDYLNGANFITQSLGDKTKKIATTEFVQNGLNDIINIEQGNIMFGSTVVGTVFRQVNFVYGIIQGGNRKDLFQTFTIPERFRPKTKTRCGYDISYGIVLAIAGGLSPVCYVNTNGNIEFDNSTAIFGDTELRGIYFGYEIT